MAGRDQTCKSAVPWTLRVQSSTRTWKVCSWGGLEQSPWEKEIQQLFCRVSAPSGGRAEFAHADGAIAQWRSRVHCCWRARFLVSPEPWVLSPQTCLGAEHPQFKMLFEELHEMFQRRIVIQAKEAFPRGKYEPKTCLGFTISRNDNIENIIKELHPSFS